jgi:branched-chain amino acid transport system permease protein
VLAILPLLGLPSYFFSFLILFFIFLAMAEAWNLLAGYTGLISLGQGAFVGLSGYMLGVFTEFGYPFYVAIIIGCITATVFAVVASKPLFKMRGIYFAVGTLVVAELLRIFFTVFRPPGASPVTWGGAGISIKATIYMSRLDI